MIQNTKDFNKLHFFTNGLGEILTDAEVKPAVPEDTLPEDIRKLYDAYAYEDWPMRYIVTLNGESGVLLNGEFNKSDIAEAKGQPVTDKLLDDSLQNLTAYATALEKEFDPRCTVFVNQDAFAQNLNVFIPGSIGNEDIQRCIESFKAKFSTAFEEIYA